MYVSVYVCRGIKGYVTANMWPEPMITAVLMLCSSLSDGQL